LALTINQVIASDQIDETDSQSFPGQGRGYLQLAP
jgi:hypothetical protein